MPQSMDFTFDIAGAQINGDRDYQEDAFLVTLLPGEGDGGGSLVIVADGMGGHAAGNVASNLAVQTFNKHVTGKFPGASPSQVLRDAVLAANGSIQETVNETPALRGMGCTFVGVLLSGSQLRWVSVGDSHVYLLREGRLIKQNADHSYGGFLDRLAAAGKHVEPEAGFSRNMLMSALTGEEIAEIDCPEEPLQLMNGDRIVVATDGLDGLSSERIVELCSGFKTARECVEGLLKGITDAAIPRQDNATVVIVDARSKSAPATFAPSPAPATPASRPAPPPRPTPPPIPSPRTLEERRREASRRRALYTLALLAVLAAGGGWLWMTGRLPGLSGPEPAPPAAPEVVETPAPEVVPEPAPAAPPPPAEPFRDPMAGGGEGPVMVWVPEGAYLMGSSAIRQEFEERPQHEVRVGRFAMSRHEVTVAEYARFARATGRRAPGAGEFDAEVYPVTYVSWTDAVAYAEWLSTETGARYRLPSEAEWEYAARAGSETLYWWGDTPAPGKAFCFGCAPGLEPRQPTRVGSLEPNAFGLHDMAGNVAEWVRDCFHENYEGAPADGSAWESEGCPQRVARGGSFMSVVKSLRSAAREAFPPDQTYDNVGLRVVREP